MNQCTYCGTTILFGGVKDGELRFCNEKCHEAGALALQAQRLPPEVVARATAEVICGACPVCGGPGPVDVFTSYRVFSALVVTSWRSRPRICCRGCATKSQLLDSLYCLVLGWWGIPWGFVMTPIQIVRNLAGLSREADSKRPSKLLESMVRARLASEGFADLHPGRAA